MLIANLLRPGVHMASTTKFWSSRSHNMASALDLTQSGPSLDLRPKITLTWSSCQTFDHNWCLVQNVGLGLLALTSRPNLWSHLVSRLWPKNFWPRFEHEAIIGQLALTPALVLTSWTWSQDQTFALTGVYATMMPGGHRPWLSVNLRVFLWFLSSFLNYCIYIHRYRN